MTDIAKKMRRIRRIVPIVGGALVCGALLVGCAAPSRSNDAQVQTLGALFQQALPIGKIVDAVSAADPRWPFQASKNPVDAAKLACVRGELTGARIAARQLDDASRYAAQHPGRVQGDIALLQAGAAKGLGGAMLVGANKRSSNVNADSNASKFSDLTPSEAMSMYALMHDSDNEDLRRAMHVEGIAKVATTDQQSPAYGANVQKAGQSVGANMLTSPLLAAMDKCKLPLSVLE